MSDKKINKDGHDVLYLIVVDENGQADKALRYAMKSVKKSRVGLAVLYVQSEDDNLFMPWGGVKETIADAKKQSAKEFLEDVTYKLEEKNISPVIYQKEGKAVEAVESVLKDDKRIVKLILEANTSSREPGPLVSYFSGAGMKDLSVPLTIVPSHLDVDDIDAIV